MTREWFASDSGRRMMESILSFQAPNGGWSKHVDFTLHSRLPGESYFAESDKWEWISTIDNQSTTEEIRFLERANRPRRDGRIESAISRGIDYLLASQYPNGCFPQVYPVQGSYHDAATFNDDATINVLRLLHDVSSGDYAMASSAQRQRARDAVAAGVECILDAQVKLNGKLTIWGQQHDPLTLEPTSARSYEPASLAALESVSIVDFLMSVPSPSDRLVKSVTAAVTWMQGAAINGYRYDVYDLKKDPTAGPLWGRLYELGTNRIIMANRDGTTLYDWNKLTDRRTGYRWYTTAPAEVIAKFERWSVPRPKRP
jgi:PelA/Pel-15E family pectate lyase